jgi:hypothetical protein
MAEEEIRHPDGRIEHPSVRHEPTDASFRWVFIILVGSMVLAVVIFSSVLAFFTSYNNYQDTIRKSPFPLGPTPSGKLPGEPRLEQLDRRPPPGLEHPPSPETPDVYLRQKTKEEVLASYGKTDEDGFIHVPIDRAMKYLAGKLPARKSGPGAKAAEAADKHANGLVDSGASNSGRLFREEPKWSTK